jgi:pimeloyl-ACP methyl ester carboxylesterase
LSCKPVTFLNKDGRKLFGMIHAPDSGKPRTTPIILLSPGIKSRVAPHRLYVKLARQRSSRGFLVLRFDFSGLGDSEGTVEEPVVADFYGSVQTGRYVNDTRAAMDWMEREYKISRFVLAGLCGGAITGLLTGARDQRVDALIGFGIPVILDSTQLDSTRYLTSGELNEWRNGYLSKLTNLKSWIRVLTFKTNYRVLLEAFGGLQRAKEVAAAPACMPGKTDQVGNFNPLFPNAFEAMVSTRKMLLIFSEADRLWSICQERFAQPFEAKLERYRDNLEVYLVRDASHIFSFIEWQHDLLEQICSWLNRNYEAA